MTKKDFGGKQRKAKSKTYLIVLLLLLSVFVGVTLAFFSNSVFSTKYTQMTGKVKIEAVGKGEKSIEDKIPNSCNLEIDYDRDYGVLIPNMPIKITANCKVYKSTTMPLLRASFTVTVMDEYGNPIEIGEDDQDLSADFYSQLFALVEDKPHWYYHSGYFYYVSSENDENSILQEINATGSDVIIPFIDGENGDSITVPSYIDSSSSGLAIKIKIIFQAIQNYIPDDNGVKMDNTITNSLKIFNEFTSTLYESSPISWFTVTTLSDGTVSLSAKKGVTYPEYLRLPEKTADGKTITHISSSLVKGNNTIRNIYVPSNYTSMDTQCFKDSGLLSIDMSESNITVIEEKAFYNSKLVSIKLPKTLVEIKSKAFYNTKLTSLEIPEGCTTVGNAITIECKSLTYLSIPSTLVNFELDSIGYTPVLATIKVSENNTSLWLVSNSMLVSSSGMLLNCIRKSSAYTSITIPDDVVQVYKNVFYGIRVQTLTLGKNLTSLDFSFPSNLQSLSLGSNTNFASLTDENGNEFITSKDYKTNYVTIVASSATKITLPDAIETIATNFVPSSRIGNITDIHLGASLKLDDSGSSTDANLIKYTGLKNVSVSSSNTNIKTITGCEVVSYDGKILYNYLRNAQNAEYTVPSGVTTIVTHALSYNSILQKLTIPNGVTTINSILCYRMANLKEIVLPSTITYLGASIRYCPKLESITSYGTLGTSCFSNCSNLKTVTISNCSQVSINFLDSCPNLEWVEFTDTTPPTFASQVMMQSTNSTFVIYVPDASLEAYKTANNLSVFASRIRPVSERP